MDSELLHALDPSATTRREEASPQPQYAQPKLAMHPVLVRPPETGAHRSELEYAMDESPQLVRAWDHYAETPPPAPHYHMSSWASSSGLPAPHYDQQVYNYHTGISGTTETTPSPFNNAVQTSAGTPSPVRSVPQVQFTTLSDYAQHTLCSPSSHASQRTHSGPPCSSIIPNQWTTPPPPQRRPSHDAHSTAASPTHSEESSLHAVLGAPSGSSRRVGVEVHDPRHPEKIVLRHLPVEANIGDGGKPWAVERALNQGGAPQELSVKRGVLSARRRRAPSVPISHSTIAHGSTRARDERRMPLAAATYYAPRTNPNGHVSPRLSTPIKSDPAAPPWVGFPTKPEMLMVPYEPAAIALDSPNCDQEPAYIMSDESGQESDADASPCKRSRDKAYKQKVCATIQTAMRRHILRAMGLSSDKWLPDSHDGSPIPRTVPVRFIWTQTVLKSPHNQRMRARIVGDLVTSRSLYPHVPDASFEDREALEATFDQAFTTLRLKWRAQRNPQVAAHERRREDAKGIKARRTLRKKAKLASRNDVRKTVDAFRRPAFNSAFQLACMSSEESASDSDAGGPSRAPTEAMPIRRNPGKLVTRPPAWRSTQLCRFYDVLDDAHSSAIATQAKRGVGKKERVRGEPRSATRVMLPPKGISTWMVSKRWRKKTKEAHPALDALLRQIVDDSTGFHSDDRELVGESSDEDVLVAC